MVVIKAFIFLFNYYYEKTIEFVGVHTLLSSEQTPYLIEFQTAKQNRTEMFFRQVEWLVNMKRMLNVDVIR